MAKASKRGTQGKYPYMDGSGSLPPSFNYGLTFKDLGSTGLRQFSGYVREEFEPKLQGRQAQTIFREMLDNSSTIGAIMFAILGVMRKVEWRTEPANDSASGEQMAEFAESLRDDMSMSWQDFIVECLSMLVFGFSVHEIIYKRRLGPQASKRPGPRPGGGDLANSKYDDGLIGIRRLPIRGQDTVLKWFFGPNGETLGLTQQPYVGPTIDLPIEKLLLFRPLQHKNNPEGRSVMRNAYRPYFFIKRLEEQEAILFERMSGLPTLKLPSNLLEQAAQGDTTAVATLNAYKQIITNVRVDEQMGLLLPSDLWPSATGSTSHPMYQFEFVTPTGGTGKSGVEVSKIIERKQLEIMSTVLADFIQLGHEQRGTQSLAVTKVDLFMGAVEGWMNSIASVLNRYLLPRIWKLNGFDRNLMPQYVPDMAQRIDLDVLSNYLLRASQAGMPMFPDEELEAYVRDAAGLPDIPTDGKDRQLTIDNAARIAGADEKPEPAPAAAKPVKKDKAVERQQLDLIDAIKDLANRAPPIVKVEPAVVNVTSPDIKVDVAAPDVKVDVHMPKKGTEVTKVTQWTSEGRIAEFEKTEKDD